MNKSPRYSVIELALRAFLIAIRFTPWPEMIGAGFAVAVWTYVIGSLTGEYRPVLLWLAYWAYAAWPHYQRLVAEALRPPPPDPPADPPAST